MYAKKNKPMYGKGGMARLAQYMSGGKFPDLTGDGKVTMADILKGRGVKKYENGGVSDPRREPEIHIERKKVVQGAEGMEGKYDRDGRLTKYPVGEYSEDETMFYVDGLPVDEETAMRAYSQKAASGSGDDFNEFVKNYLLAEDPNLGGSRSQGSVRRQQRRDLRDDQERMGPAALLKALESYRR